MRAPRVVLDELREIQRKLKQEKNQKMKEFLENNEARLVGEFKTVIVELQKWIPFYGRIPTLKQGYAGLIQELVMNGKRELAFKLDCLPEQCRISLESIKDIQPWKDQDGKPIFWKNIGGENGEE